MAKKIACDLYAAKMWAILAVLLPILQMVDAGRPSPSLKYNLDLLESYEIISPPLDMDMDMDMEAALLASPPGAQFVLRRYLDEGIAISPAPAPTSSLALSSSSSPLVSGSPVSPDAGDLSRRGGKRHLSKGALATIILIPSILAVSMFISVFVAIRYRSEFFSSGKDLNQPNHPPLDLIGGPNHLKCNVMPSKKLAFAQPMEYEILQRTTDNFSPANLLGEGGFSKVFKATLDDGSVTAVKRLASEGKQAQYEFQGEVELMSAIRHENLVSLLGFCTHGEHKLLIYEFMQNGSLQDQLQGPSKGSALNWHLRMKIALESARGLEFLHDQCNPPIIHRDFKSSNILLDAAFDAKLSDFGLALSVPGGVKQGGSLQIQGTFGYVAPEYILTGVLTEKSDVYAFGVVLLELITGRKPIDMSMPTGCQSLVTWATPQLTDRTRLPLIVDPAIKDSVNLKQLFQVAAVAVLCVQSEPSYRPLIGDVVHSLVPLVPVEMGGALRLGNPPPPAPAYFPTSSDS